MTHPDPQALLDKGAGTGPERAPRGPIDSMVLKYSLPVSVVSTLESRVERASMLEGLAVDRERQSEYAAGCRKAPAL